MRKAMKIFIGAQVVGGLALVEYLKYQQAKNEDEEKNKIIRNGKYEKSNENIYRSTSSWRFSISRILKISTSEIRKRRK